MAQQRNHQLKVYNQFGGGIQNIPADHLIQEDAYSSAININTVDSTLRPTRGGKKLFDLDTPFYAKEHIYTENKLFKNNFFFDFVNYGDTIYIVNSSPRGSDVYKVLDDLTIKPAFPTIVNQQYFSATGVSDDPQTTLNNVYKKAYDKFTPDLEGLKNKLSYSKPFLDNIHPALVNLNTQIGKLATAPAVTNETLGEELEKLSNLLNTISTAVTTLKEETNGNYLERLISATANQVMPNFRNESMQYLYYLTDDGSNYYHDKMRNGYAGMIKYLNSEVMPLLNDRIDTSIWKYIGRKKGMRTYGIWGNGGNAYKVFTYDNEYSVAQKVKDKALAIIAKLDQKLTTTTAPNLASDNPDYYLDVAKEVFNSQETDFFDFLTFIYYLILVATYNEEDNHSKQYYQEYYESHPDAEYWSSTSLKTNSTRFTEAHSIATNLLTKVDEEVNAGVGSQGAFATYGLVVYDTKTKAYSNMLRSKIVYDDKGVTFNYPINHMPKGDIYVYRKAQDDKHFREVIKIPEGGSLVTSLSPPYSKEGATPSHLYRVSNPPDDFTSIAEYKGALFMARRDGQELWYTDNGDPTSLKATNFINIPQNIKAIKSAGAGLFIWTTNDTIYLLTGMARDSQGNNTLAIKRIADNTPIINSHSVASLDNIVLWLSQHGIYYTAGYGSSESTLTTWTPPKEIVDVKRTVIINHTVYFLVQYRNIVDYSIIAYDYTKRAVHEYEIPNLIDLVVADDELQYIVRPTDEYKFEAYSFSKGNTLLPYTASLKRYAGYSCDTRLRFTNVVICHTAKPYKDIDRDEALRTTVKIYVDDWLAGEEEIVGTNVTRIDLPQTNNTGYSIKLSFTGQLGIKSARIRYTTIDWED